MSDFTPKNFGKPFGGGFAQGFGEHSGPKKFDLNASHPRPELRPAKAHPNPYAPLPPADTNEAAPEFGPISQLPQQSFDPMKLTTQDLPPHTLDAQTWNPKPAGGVPAFGQDSNEQHGFVPADQLLQDMGMAPLKAPQDAQAKDPAAYVQPHDASVAEFSPPRPVRRAPTVFAHLKDKPKD